MKYKLMKIKTHINNNLENSNSEERSLTNNDINYNGEKKKNFINTTEMFLVTLLKMNLMN